MKVSVEALKQRVKARIVKLEEDQLADELTFKERMEKWRSDVLDRFAEASQEFEFDGDHIEHSSYWDYDKVNFQIPKRPDSKDFTSLIAAANRDLALLELAVDSTILVSEDSNWGQYL